MKARLARFLVSWLMCRNVKVIRLGRFVPFHGRLFCWAVREDMKRWAFIQVPGGSIVLRAHEKAHG